MECFFVCPAVYSILSGGFQIDVSHMEISTLQLFHVYVLLGIESMWRYPHCNFHFRLSFDQLKLVTIFVRLILLGMPYSILKAKSWHSVF